VEGGSAQGAGDAGQASFKNKIHHRPIFALVAGAS